MKTKHTPAPWDMYGVNVNGIQIRHGLVEIVKISSPLDSYDVANGYLIAAAPELLKALKRIVFDGGKERLIGSETAEDREALKKAIAKAEGKIK